MPSPQEIKTKAEELFTANKVSMGGGQQEIDGLNNTLQTYYAARTFWRQSGTVPTSEWKGWTIADLDMFLEAIKNKVKELGGKPLEPDSE